MDLWKYLISEIATCPKKIQTRFFTNFLHVRTFFTKQSIFPLPQQENKRTILLIQVPVEVLHSGHVTVT